MAEGVYKVDANRFIGVDHGGGEFHTEAEFELLPDGTIFFHEIRQTPVRDGNEEKQT